MRYFIEISFDGTDYFGWQVQPNKKTIQGEFNDILSKILQEKINVVGCGRTDTGVHAKQFFLHFDTTKTIPSNLAHKLNQMLSDQIVVHDLFAVAKDFHSRFDAKSRSYLYHLHFEKSPFHNRFSTYCYYRDLDISAMQEVANFLVKINDFSALSKFNEDVKNSLCTIYESKLIHFEEENRLEFHITANRFLHNMIRRIIGLLVNVGRKKMTVEEVKETLLEQKALPINSVAGPQGLFLNRIEYDFSKIGE